jgi:ATP-dependent Clp protease ATP-binding subunit ClpA/ATP-dependent Clp protease ATP-binding subunit ClpC
VRHAFRIAVYERRSEGRLSWWPLATTLAEGALHGKSELRLREELARRLRQLLRTLPPAAQELLEAVPGTRVHHVSLDVAIAGVRAARIGGRFPFVVEPRWFDDDHQRLCAYHPADPLAWFDAADLAEVEALAPHFVRKAWRGLTDEAIGERKANGKDRVITVELAAEPRTLLDQVRERARGRQRAGAARGPRHTLAQLGVDQTARAIDGTLPVGVPRPALRAQLERLLGGGEPRSTLLVGRPGAGRSTVLARWVADRLEADGWSLHRSLERVRRVWKLSGRRLIAGMQYFGDWEERCLDLATEAGKSRAILWLDDLHLFGRLGVSRQSERSFADFFRGPLQRGELTIVGTITPEQLARLEADAPAFVDLFARVPVAATGAAETGALLLAEVRRLEREQPVEVHPFTARTVSELAASLFPWTAAPGAAIELLRRVVRERAPASADAARGPRAPRVQVVPADVIATVTRVTGLPAHLLTLDQPLDPAQVVAHFARRVIGQDEAVAVAADVVLAVRAGLTDPARPLGVYLFTGPTGTGKTELATALAEYLYGDARRLLRLDMSELAGPDAVARLVGDRWQPEGLLTGRIREQPFSLVLLDEIEKAHPAVLGLLLQLFDEGRLTDAAGEVASFRQAVVVMTSNLGARAAAPVGFGDGVAAILGDIARAVREFFPPELWNRIDRVVRFRPLTPEVAARVVDKELAKLLGRRGLRERNVFVYAGRAVRERAVAQAFDPRYGARTVKRWLEDQVATTLAEALASAAPARLTEARLRDQDGQIVVDLDTLPEAAPVAGDYPMLAWREQTLATLAPVVAATALALDRALDGPRLPALRARAAAQAAAGGGDVRYYVEAYADALLATRIALVGERRAPPVTTASDDDDAALADDDPRGDHDDDERDEDEHDEDEHAHDLGRPVVRTVRGDSPRGRSGEVVSSRGAVRAPGRRHQALDQPATLATLARARFLLAHADAVLDPAAHRALVHLTIVGATDGGRRAQPGLGALCVALRPFVDSHAFGERGQPKEGKGIGGTAEAAEAGQVGDVAAIVDTLLAARALAGEHGCHVFQSQSDEPEIVRLAIGPATEGTAREQLVAILAARAAFDEALAAGDRAAPNPEPLLPVVRTLSWARPLRYGESMPIAIEDFASGMVATVVAPQLVDAIRAAMHVRWTRTGAEARSAARSTRSGEEGP